MVSSAGRVLAKLTKAPEQREWFFKEFVYYMNMTVRELQHRVEGVVPSFDEYVEVRLGTSAVSTAFVLIEWVPAWTIILA